MHLKRLAALLAKRVCSSASFKRFSRSRFAVRLAAGILGCALSASMAAGQATRPAGADTKHEAPATAPASNGPLPQQPQQRKASEGSSVEAQPIRRETTQPANGSGNGGAARR